MSLPLLVFVATGLLFGLATFRHRHLFSEGSTRPSPDDRWPAWLGWVALSTALWPLFAVSGLFGLAYRRRLVVIKPTRSPLPPPAQR